MARVFLYSRVIIIPMSQNERIFFIVRRLNGGSVTLKEVASQFEISTRQVRRDIEYMRERLDAPIIYDKDSMAYRLDRPWDAKGFTDEKMLIMHSFFSSVLHNLSLGSLMEHEVGTLIEQGLSQEAKAITHRIIYHAPIIDLPDYRIFSQVLSSIEKEKSLYITYRNLVGNNSERVIECLRLINYENAWYVVAFDHKSGELRTFHLSRIKSAESSQEKSVFKDESALTLFLDNGFGIMMGGGEKESYTMHFTGNAAHAVMTQIWDENQKLLRQDDDITLTVIASGPEELLHRLLFFGADAWPVSPPSFVDAYDKIVDQMLQRRGCRKA